MYIFKFSAILFLLLSNLAFSQGSPDYDGGMKIKFNEDGSKYLRFISWVQGQANYNTNAGTNQQELSMQVRRARLLMFSQITDKFMVLTHFGLNSLNAGSMSPTGGANSSHIFLHDAWAQYTFSPKLTIGTGLHYYNGISRLNNQSTLNMLTMDNHRSSWATLGLSDQFARHIGVFAKGSLGKLQYQLAFNDAMTNSLDARTPIPGGDAVYQGKQTLGADASKSYAGYLQYGFWDQESNFLPFKVGSYLGTKKVLNLGAGFFSHPKGAITVDLSSQIKGENVGIFAVDAFYDAPLSEKGDAITAYAVYQNNNYGKDYLYASGGIPVYGTGSMFYAHAGYLLPGKKEKLRIQPYVAYGQHSYDASNDDLQELKVGVNGYISGHNAKLTLEYDSQSFGSNEKGFVNLQAMIYL